MTKIGVTITFVLMGALFALLGAPLALGRVARNHYYGFRTQKTLADDSVWFEANRVQGVDLMLAGAFIAAAAVLVHARSAEGSSPQRVALLDTVALIAALLAVAGHGLGVVSRL